MDFDAVSKWLGFASLVISVITAIWTLVNKSTKPYDDKLHALEVSKAQHDRRIQSLEEELKHLPNKEMVHQIQLAIARMEGHLGKVEASGAATERTVRRIDDYLSKGPA
jgi:ABC-type nickel/cobalt efflux system permease component RcnA